MYSIIKEKGSMSVVFLKNNTTKDTLSLGGITMKLLDILKDNESLTAEDGSLELSAEWDIEIKEKTKEELARLTMPMKKPIRDQSKKYKPAKEKASKSGEVDLFNLIYGNVE